MFKVLAGTQVFQAVYIDTDAPKKTDTIVFIEDLVETLPHAEGILNTMLKEPYFGIVFSGSGVNVAKFRHKIYELDQHAELGKLDIKTLLKTLVDESKKCGCIVEYIKAPHLYTESPEQTLEASGVEFRNGKFTVTNISPIVVKKQYSLAFDLFGTGRKLWENFADFLFDTDYKKFYSELEKMDGKRIKELRDFYDNPKNKKMVEELRTELKGLKNDQQKKEIEKVLKDLDSLDVKVGKDAEKPKKLEEQLGIRLKDAKFFMVDPAQVPELSSMDKKPKALELKLWNMLEEDGMSPRDYVVHYAKNGTLLVISHSGVKIDEPWFQPLPTLKEDELKKLLGVN